MRTSTLIIVSLVLVMYLLVEMVEAQNCKGKPRSPKCVGLMNQGNNSKRRCKKQANRVMWNYNAALNRTCVQMEYKGCGGNDNRWCTKQACETACRR